MQKVMICHLGRVEYGEAWALQQKLQARLIAAKRATPLEEIPHIFLMVEHPHVYTLGKSGDMFHLLLSEERLAEIGATFFKIDRGGDITYHGLGQLVGYPILDLDRFFTDIGKYLRLLEEVMIRTCAEFGMNATRVSGRTGVWIEADEKGDERKICAMGIRCSRWVTMHGFALNLNTNLDYFSYIVPCGIADRGVTSFAKERGDTIDESVIRQRIAFHFGELFEAETAYLEGKEAMAFLEQFLDAKSD